MKRYSPEFKEAVIRKMMPPDRVASRSEFASEVANVPIMRLAEESGVSYVTLAKWREEARSGGEAAPGNGEQPERWSSEDKFLIVLETHPLNAAELGEYCRSKGIFPEEIEAWREACLQANRRDLKKRSGARRSGARLLRKSCCERSGRWRKRRRS